MWSKERGGCKKVKKEKAQLENDQNRSLSHPSSVIGQFSHTNQSQLNYVAINDDSSD